MPGEIKKKKIPSGTQHTCKDWHCYGLHKAFKKNNPQVFRIMPIPDTCFISKHFHTKQGESKVRQDHLLYLLWWHLTKENLTYLSAVKKATNKKTSKQFEVGKSLSTQMLCQLIFWEKNKKFKKISFHLTFSLRKVSQSLSTSLLDP